MVNADSEFFTSFNGALPEFETSYGETWLHERTATEYPAIAMDRETATSRAMSGGKYVTAESMLFVREDVCVASGVKKGDIITARGDRFAVTSIDRDGDACRTLVLGPVAIDVWR